MSTVSKKKILGILDDLQEGNQALQGEKEEILSDIWLDNIHSFGGLICMLGDYFLQSAEYGGYVSQIEEYCQSLQRLEGQLGQRKEREKTCKGIRTQLKKLVKDIQQTYPDDKKELVFFPYMYAMWDSMESVWRAAVDSGEFDVYVVPIPYYEKNPDGSFGEMHYDGGEYPDEVQAISWESYQVSERKPDVVYVHNPYDDMNRVTSIHPNFYAGNLKPHVGSLVYIPYFVFQTDALPRHFCVTPVTQLADKIIVQSKAVAEIYIEELYAFSQKHTLNWSVASLEQKVLPLGSPKLDKVKEAIIREEELPDDWKKLLYRGDGSRKKVIFYNTTLSAVLEFGAVDLDKIEDSLAIFEQKKEQVTLLWRPHPLLEETLKSMLPQLYLRYMQIKSKYQMANWGILDETKDFNRAVSISDGYYGDSSSVVPVFQEVKKPVMLVNVKVMKSEKEGG